MLTARIQRYDTNTANGTECEIHLPAHVTITGQEDHFALAYHDTQMVIAGMRAMDQMLELDRDKNGNRINIIYRIQRIG